MISIVQAAYFNPFLSVDRWASVTHKQALQEYKRSGMLFSARLSSGYILAIILLGVGALPTAPPARIKSFTSKVATMGGKGGQADSIMVTHPTGGQPTALFHGVYDSDDVESIIKKVDLAKSAKAGDFHLDHSGMDVDSPSTMF